MSNNTRKRYSAEFKAQAIKRARDIGAYQVCEELGISNGSIYKWMAAAGYKPGPEDNPANLETQNPFELAEEIKQLKKELTRVKEEREILKKATVSSIDHSNTYNNFLITIRCSEHDNYSNQLYTTRESRIMG
jgi:transposase